MTTTDTATRTDDVLTDLLTANHEAKRQPHVLGTPEWPSKWHEWIDLLLEDWQAQGCG